MHWTIDERPDQQVDVDALAVNEVGADGHITAVVYFDLDDRAAAFAEMERRFVAAEAAGCAEGQAPISAFDAAFAARGWTRLHETLAEDFVSRDHRTGWMGASDRDQYVSSIRVFAELSPDVTSENVEILAWGDHGRVVRTRVCGTQGDAGPFENDFVWMLVTGAGRVRQVEVWSVDEADAALDALRGGRLARSACHGERGNTSDGRGLRGVRSPRLGRLRSDPRGVARVRGSAADGAHGGGTRRPREDDAVRRCPPPNPVRTERGRDGR